MEQCLHRVNPVPQWYMAIKDNKIIGGLGVIENDFHNRKDLAPNVCAVYTEKDKRCNGIAGALLEYVCVDMKKKGIDTELLINNYLQNIPSCAILSSNISNCIGGKNGYTC